MVVKMRACCLGKGPGLISRGHRVGPFSDRPAHARGGLWPAAGDFRSGGRRNWLFSGPTATLPLPYERSVGRIRGLVFGACKTVANIKSAEKRARQTIKRRANN